MLYLAALLTAGLVANPSPAPAAETYPELLTVMHDIQRYAEKLWLSGGAQNAELAEWYRWKIVKEQKRIREGRTQPYAYNGWDAQDLIAMLDEPLEQLEVVFTHKDWSGFSAAFENLTSHCNACHVATEHPFIRITTPTDTRPYPSQDFTP